MLFLKFNTNLSEGNAKICRSKNFFEWVRKFDTFGFAKDRL